MSAASPIGVKHALIRFKNQLLSSTDVGVDSSTIQELFEKFSCCGSVASDGFASDPAITVPSALRSSCLDELISGSRNDCFDSSQDEIGVVVGLLLSTLMSCNHDTRRECARHIIFCGGGSSIPGLPQKVCTEASEKIRHDSSLSLSSSLGSIEYRPIDFHRCLLTWIGSSIFASLKSNEGKYISYNDWESKKRASRGAEQSHSASMSMPDWMSLNPSDWKFAGPSTYVSVKSEV